MILNGLMLLTKSQHISFHMKGRKREGIRGRLIDRHPDDER